MEQKIYEYTTIIKKGKPFFRCIGLSIYNAIFLSAIIVFSITVIENLPLAALIFPVAGILLLIYEYVYFTLSLNLYEHKIEIILPLNDFTINYSDINLFEVKHEGFNTFIVGNITIKNRKSKIKFIARDHVINRSGSFLEVEKILKEKLGNSFRKR